MTNLEKRLLAAMHLGITIEYRDGHRWINFHDSEYGYNSTAIELVCRSKVYGNLLDALDQIDLHIGLICRSSDISLLDLFENRHMEEEHAYDLKGVYD